MAERDICIQNMLNRIFKKISLVLVAVVVTILSFTVAKNQLAVNASTKNVVKKNITLIEGQTYRLERPDSKEMDLVNEYLLEPKRNLSKITNKNKKVAVLKRKNGDSYNNVKGKKVYDKYVDIKALKAGKTTLRFNLKLQDGKKYSYKILVKVKKLEKMQQRSKKFLQKYEEGLKAGDKYAYIDLNNDKVEELIVAGKIYYFDYSVNKVKSIKNHFSDVIAGTNKSFLGILKKPVVKSNRNGTITTFGKVYLFDTSRIFGIAETTYSYRKYDEKAMKYYGVKNIYTFHDTSYDQDDYDYQAMDEVMLNKHIRKYVKNAVKVNWLVK